MIPNPGPAAGTSSCAWTWRSAACVATSRSPWMTPAEARACALEPRAGELLAELYARQRLSGRAHDRALRLAQTVADLEGAESIGEAQMAQALQLRRRDRG